jgi:hypothetical protein
MIETGNRARPRTATPAPRLTPRAVRVRNGCLATLARARSMPAPSANDFAALGDDVSFGAAWDWWSARQGGAPRVVTRATPAANSWWRSRRLAWTVVVVAALASAWAVGAQVWSRATISEEPGIVEPLWSTVSANDVANANTVLLRLGQTSAGLSVSLSAAEVASLAFRSALRRQPPSVANLEARIDSMLSIRGMMIGDGAGQFELRGRLRIVRPRLAQIDVVEMRVTDPTTGRGLQPVPNAANGYPPVQFAVPSYVEATQLVDGHAVLVRRTRP